MINQEKLKKLKTENVMKLENALKSWIDKSQVEDRILTDAAMGSASIMCTLPESIGDRIASKDLIAVGKLLRQLIFGCEVDAEQIVHLRRYTKAIYVHVGW